MLEKIGKWFRNKIFNHYDCCFTDREYEGIAAMGCCSGLAGGDKNSGYLQYDCIDCPYFVNVSEIEEKIYGTSRKKTNGTEKQD